MILRYQERDHHLSEMCLEVASAATALLNAMECLAAVVSRTESRDRLDQAGRLVGALALWADAWACAYAHPEGHTALEMRESTGRTAARHPGRD